MGSPGLLLFTRIDTHQVATLPMLIIMTAFSRCCCPVGPLWIPNSVSAQQPRHWFEIFSNNPKFAKGWAFTFQAPMTAGCGARNVRSRITSTHSLPTVFVIREPFFFEQAVQEKERHDQIVREDSYGAGGSRNGTGVSVRHTQNK